MRMLRWYELGVKYETNELFFLCVFFFAIKLKWNIKIYITCDKHFQLNKCHFHMVLKSYARLNVFGNSKFLGQLEKLKEKVQFGHHKFYRKEISKNEILNEVAV